MATEQRPQIIELAPIQQRRPSDPERAKLVRRAQLLAWGGNIWHVFEFAVAIGAGIAAGSIALIGFGADSLIEALAGGIILWRLAARRIESEEAERRAQRLIAVTYLLLAIYIGIESCRSFLGGGHPGASWLGIGLALVTAPTMPALAIAKRRVGRALGSHATEHEGTQNMLCAYLSVALLVGLGANALFGWWWADPAAALVIAAVAVKEGVEGWQGEDTCQPPRFHWRVPQPDAKMPATAALRLSAKLEGDDQCLGSHTTTCRAASCHRGGDLAPRRMDPRSECPRRGPTASERPCSRRQPAGGGA